MKIKLMALLLVLPLVGAEPAGYKYWSAAELKSMAKPLSNKTSSKTSSENLGNFGRDHALLVHREGSGVGELHETEADVIMVVSGTATSTWDAVFRVWIAANVGPHPLRPKTQAGPVRQSGKSCTGDCSKGGSTPVAPQPSGNGRTATYMAPSTSIGGGTRMQPQGPSAMVPRGGPARGAMPARFGFGAAFLRAARLSFLRSTVSVTFFVFISFFSIQRTFRSTSLTRSEES